VPELIEPLHRIHKGDREPVEQVSRVVIESGACDEVRRRAHDYTRRAVDELEALVPGPARALLQGVAHQLAERAA